MVVRQRLDGTPAAEAARLQPEVPQRRPPLPRTGGRPDQLRPPVSPPSCFLLPSFILPSFFLAPHPALPSQGQFRCRAVFPMAARLDWSNQ